MIKTMKGNVRIEKKEDEFWSKGAFIEPVNPNDAAKMRTFHMKHDEEMEHNCNKCSAKISAHNKDWHNGMCDKCFNDEYFPED